MSWIKKGLIFVPSKKIDWMKTHASLPIADKIKNNLYRFYFSSRDFQNKSNVGYIEVNISNPKKILKICEKPVLSPGKLGTFDDCGAMAASLVNCDNKKYLYYIGWNQSKTVPFRWSVGLAISNDDGETFQRFSDGPILDRNNIDPYFVSSPTVIFEEGKWRMWYISGLRWEEHNNNLRIPYHIRYAESNDGINWSRDGTVCIDFNKKNETRIGRASVLKEKNLYKMWYSYALDNYRIGYAESNDGKKWIRKDEEVDLDVSSSNWDSEMIEYPYVFLHNDTKFMLYNGNNYGETGFGYAIIK